MAQHPFNDRLKVLVSSDKFGYGGQKKGVESGIVVEVPEKLLYLSFHNFGFENSLANPKLLEVAQGFYNDLLGKKIAWESLQDRGRRFKEGDDEYVYIQMTDVLFWADDENEDIQLASEGGFSA